MSRPCKPKAPTGPAWPRVWCGGPAEPVGAPALQLEVLVATKSEANERGFFEALNRKKKQDAALEEALFDVVVPPPPWCVRMTRLSPSSLDDDNLGSAFKRVRDRLAQWLGVDDRASAVAFCVAQERRRGEPGVRIEVWGAGGLP